jgi:hypothetical protein
MEEENYITYTGFALFLISELLPFIKSANGNGVADIFYCFVCNSSCMRPGFFENNPQEDIPEPPWIPTANVASLPA